MPNADDMDQYADEIKNLLIDDFATLSGLINDRKYAETSVFMTRLAQSMARLAPAFALEAIARKLDQVIQKEDDE